MQERTGVVVVAAEHVHQLGLAAAVESQYSVISTVGTMREASYALELMAPALSLLVLDPPLPDATLQQACTVLIARHPETASLVLLRKPDRATVRLVCRAGGRGVYDTTVSASRLRAALVQIEAGETSIQTSLARHLVGSDSDRDDHLSGGAGEPVPLTSGQLRVMRLLARGFTGKEIAAELSVSEDAVHNMIERATRRLGASHRTQAVAMAVERGLIA